MKITRVDDHFTLLFMYLASLIENMYTDLYQYDYITYLKVKSVNLFSPPAHYLHRYIVKRS